MYKFRVSMKECFKSFYICLFLIFLQNISVLAWTVSPVRFEIKGEKGKEYTLTFSVLNESQLYQKRFEIQTDDWIIDKNNNFLRKAFSKGVDNKYSATSWVKVTPLQFTVPPGMTKKIRFTISLPKDLPSSGEYTTGIFVGEQNIEKPPKGEKVVHIKQDTFIGVVVYVSIGEEKRDVVLKDLKVNIRSVGKNSNKVILVPTFVNQGNVHARAEIEVKSEPVSMLEVEGVPESKDKKLLKEYKAGEIVVLRESEVSYAIEVPEPLPEGSEWRFIVSADFGGLSPTLIGTKKYLISSSKEQSWLLPKEKHTEKQKQDEVKSDKVEKKLPPSYH